MDDWTCAYAAEGGHLEVLKWAREQNCRWDVRTVDAAQRSGCAETIQFVFENGCPTDILWSDVEEDDSDSESESESDIDVDGYSFESVDAETAAAAVATAAAAAGA
jgi:hypothetical protein